jgi:peptidoglycan/LPS O-acetylase OafA/YrhL
MFAIGALAAGVQLRLARTRSWLFDIFAVLAIALMIWRFAVQYGRSEDSGFGWLGIPYDFPWFILVVGAILVTAPSSLLVGRVLDNPVTRYVARISFGIYVWHYVVLELVRVWWLPGLTYANFADTGAYILACVVVAGVSGLIAHLSYYLLELRFIRWAQRPGTDRAAATLSPAAG